MAQISMMSYSRCAFWFKQLMQTSLTSYILFLRLRKAEQLLISMSPSVTEIALESGFNSPSYFIKQFKRAKGISPPMQYRKQMLQHTVKESHNK
ncbi:helix-turn-helix domain-containing protein [Paenibacillus swuensis]|uniref:helix-turn-helix domain-containing protein n=1 Tax=Paenibacillus swuensis TaxID=1178515 RepID=UPI0018D39585|nr:AraC family transcriptional regulator [Paenibacillus swuensis]